MGHVTKVVINVVKLFLVSLDITLKKTVPIHEFWFSTGICLQILKIIVLLKYIKKNYAQNICFNIAYTNIWSVTILCTKLCTQKIIEV